MNLLGLMVSTGASLLALSLVFYPLEKAFPAKAGQKIFRREWATDLCFMLGQYLLWSSAVLFALGFVREYAGAMVPADWRGAIAAQPWWLQAIEVIALSDLTIYWGHRLQHRYDFLWRFHAVHHTAEHLDWLAAHREHPFDALYTQTLINLPAFLLGFPLETLAGLVAFRGLWAIYIHSNVRLPIGPLRWIIGAPELHHWHHARERLGCNYANLSPLMDIVFGTYRCPPVEPVALGVEEPFPRSYLGQLWHPFHPQRHLATEPTEVALPVEPQRH
jgi:sterol desaturase/sphingolipid hydroxylase (fatty acid hydroxylase superfamily)